MVDNMTQVKTLLINRKNEIEKRITIWVQNNFIKSKIFLPISINLSTDNEKYNVFINDHGKIKIVEGLNQHADITVYSNYPTLAYISSIKIEKEVKNAFKKVLSERKMQINGHTLKGNSILSLL